MNIKERLIKNFYKTSSYVKHNNTTILTGLSVLGVVVTAVLVAKETLQVSKKLEVATYEKGEPLTKLEKVIITTPVYMPAILFGASTIGCIVSANALNIQKQETLASAYMMLDATYKTYKNKIIEVHGDAEANNIDALIRTDKYDNRIMNIPTKDGGQLFCDELSGHFFESTMKEVIDAEYQFNRMFALKGEVLLKEFYELLDIPITSESEVVGYDITSGEEFYGYSWIDFEHPLGCLEDGTEYYIISLPLSPHLYHDLTDMDTVDDIHVSNINKRLENATKIDYF